MAGELTGLSPSLLMILRAFFSPRDCLALDTMSMPAMGLEMPPVPGAPVTEIKKD